ncbi:hypothetical protein OG749_36240 [Streptomyces nojiriensis]|uniref:hypothetical protein n=1 Tax=Streptomyces nojiriensis TaxID=66374 RepID=UPI002E174C96
MGKTYTGRKGVKDLERDAKPGMRVYYINEHSTKIAGQFEERTYSTLFCTHRGGLLTTGWMFSNGSDYHGKIYSKRGTITAADAVLYHGGVSTTPPPGLRELSSPEPDCRDEGYRGLGPGGSYAGRLDTQTLDYMDGHAKQAQADRDERAGKRKRGWF